ncbi:MAG: hypothetical protein AB1758_25300 [Candidatus Eremiobacterota bacterium]
MASVGIFSVMLVVTALLFNDSIKVWRSTSGADTANREMRKARTALERDLILARPSELRRVAVPDSLGGGGNDGEALWFLSPVDPATGTMVRKADGTPFWQRNILYYMVVPNNHQNTFKMSCTGGAGPGGFDDRCPHKVLIRKVIDSGTPTVVTDETTEETLLPDVSAYLTRPNGYDLSGMGGEPGLAETRVVGAQLLTFFSQSVPGPEVAVTLQAVAVDEARRQIQLGTAALSSGPFSYSFPFSVFLRN